ncbi:MAG: ribonuclease HII [Candidatus Lloydbacteria bacterium RIFCSPHIGHO2_01_FULL_41_20]|uniref:Ribonuclease HII n=1 Tax=Candidatus Lloydbacteria bacterium RIFCSPHIGHO2_01_FULL_41_20 TaxID=1798657 RepID=A0A1G2CTA8_9BACT|nr:MAG: ribonuclease HII [Candidatus Lloydbacteria bacterium RIFCSPHIGHO2_01_FULL_41_20]
MKVSNGMKKTRNFVVGIDEVGRGPIAGPLAVGAVLLDKKHKKILRGIKDSKKLSPDAREKWHEKIKKHQEEGIIKYEVFFVNEKVIDKKGLSHSLKFAVSNCLKALGVDKKTEILLDGSLYAPDVYINQKTIIKGDEKEVVISAASIMAKVMRDKRMVSFSKKYPKYGFEKHKGYGTKAHYRAIKKHGLSKIHRKSFRNLRG